MTTSNLNPVVNTSSSSISSNNKNSGVYSDMSKGRDVRGSNLQACKMVSDLIRTSLGPRGLDKMISNPSNENKLIISNDGATILDSLNIRHPAAKMLVQLSKAQDKAAGDGTTSCVILCGEILQIAERMINKGTHPTTIATNFEKAKELAINHLAEYAIDIDLKKDRETLIKNAKTSLSSKIVSQHSMQLAPLCVDAVMSVYNSKETIDIMKNIRVLKVEEGTIEDTQLIKGLVLKQNIIKSAGGPSKMEKAKIALIQFQLSAPKPDMDNNIVINDYHLMDKILKEERMYLLDICKKIKKSGANVVLIQKSILRDATSELALHFLAKLNIMVIKDIERDEIEIITKSINCKAVAHIDALSEEKLGSCDVVEELKVENTASIEGQKKLVVFRKNNNSIPKIDPTNIESTPISTTNNDYGNTVTLICRGSNKVVVDEVHRSMHDAMCCIKALTVKTKLVPGGGSTEMHLSARLKNEALNNMQGIEAICTSEFANALECIPYTLAENSGLYPVKIIAELQKKHALAISSNECCYYGLNVRKGKITNMINENVVQPILVTQKALELATETVIMLLKIDDIIMAR